VEVTMTSLIAAIENAVDYVHTTARADGAKVGRVDRAAGKRCDDWPSEQYRAARVEYLCWNLGLNVNVLDVDHRARLEHAYVSGYRPAYIDAYYDGEVW
jgi:hypothetical protein